MWGCYEVRARTHACICIKARVIAFKHCLSSLLLLLSLVILETGKAFFTRLVMAFTTSGLLLQVGLVKRLKKVECSYENCLAELSDQL